MTDKVEVNDPFPPRPDLDRIMEKDRPLDMLGKMAEQALRSIPGSFVILKWTCRGCGERVEGSEPNAFFQFAVHEETEAGEPCGHETDLGKYGAGFALITGGEEAKRLWAEAVKADRTVK